VIIHPSTNSQKYLGFVLIFLHISFCHNSIFDKKNQCRIYYGIGTNIKEYVVPYILFPFKRLLYAWTHSRKDMRVIPFLLPSFPKFFHFHYYVSLYCPSSSHSIFTIFCDPARKSFPLVKRKIKPQRNLQHDFPREHYRLRFLYWLFNELNRDKVNILIRHF
jgi:hypothetical protein